MQKIKPGIIGITHSISFSQRLLAKYDFFRQRSYLPFLVFLRFVYLGALRTSVINRMHTSHFNFNFQLSELNYFYKIASHSKAPETSYLSFRVKREIFNQALSRVQVCNLNPVFPNPRSGRQFHNNQNVRFQTSNQYKTTNLKQHKESPSLFNRQTYFSNRDIYKNFQVQVTNLNPHGNLNPHEFNLRNNLSFRVKREILSQALRRVQVCNLNPVFPNPCSGRQFHNKHNVRLQTSNQHKTINLKQHKESPSLFNRQTYFSNRNPYKNFRVQVASLNPRNDIQVQAATPYRIANLHMAKNVTVRRDSVINTSEGNYFTDRVLHFNDRYVQRHELRELEKTLDKTRESVRESAKNNSSTFDNITRILKQIPDMDSLSDRVYRNMERRIRMERERRGM